MKTKRKKGWHEKNNLNTTRQKRRIPRIPSLVLAIVMVITSVPDMALASEIFVEQIVVEDDAAQGMLADAAPADVSTEHSYSVSPVQQDDGIIIGGGRLRSGREDHVCLYDMQEEGDERDSGYWSQLWQMDDSHRADHGSRWTSDTRM